MSKLVTIYGGSGFVGRYVARRMAKEGWRVRVACRRPNEAMFVKPYGVVGQVEPVFCNIRDDASVRTVMRGADAVVNCVGTFDARGRNNFDAVQVEGAERVARIAAEEQVARMVHLSAIGADPVSDSVYSRTKAEGEAMVRNHRPDAVILRPSVVFGPEDAFFNRFAAMTRFGPVLPVIGAETRMQPVYVDDLAQAVVKGILGQAEPGVYEIGGPEVQTFRELMNTMLKTIQRRRLVLNIPFGIARIMAGVFSIGSMLSAGLIKPPVTPDQVRSLQVDNVVADGAKTLADLGISPTAIESVVPEYLWPFRPSGQYAAIKDSAKNLKA
ncbi:MAG: complex I NDUFA9 subunit family protein [Rhodobacter sp.]|jgi:NADH dehydrogenase|nr:complex I NDUFA9 subunit family protein [Rhodobacter sp.]